MFFAFKDSLPPRADARTWYQVRKKIGDIRNTLPAGHPGAVLQRRVRRHLHQHLRDHRRRLRLPRPEGIRRPRPRRAPARARRGQGRLHRRAGREDLRRDVEREARAARHRAGADRADARGAERGRGGRRVRHGDRPHLPAPDRRVRLARRDPRHRDPREQPRVPAGRHRGRVARLRRSAAAEDALARARGARHRRHDGEGRRRDRARPRARREDRARSRPQLPVGVEIGHVASMPRAVQRSVHEFMRSLAEAVRDRARGVAREPRPAHRARRRGVDPAGARDDVRRSCGCSTSACTRSRSAR